MEDRQRRILVVDDLERWREQLVEMLQREGFYADSVSTAAEVLQRLDATFYHLLILDIRLEDADQTNTDGIDLLREIAKRGMSELTKIIILSAYNTEGHMRVIYKDCKVAKIIPKEKFTKKVLLESVQQVLSE